MGIFQDMHNGNQKQVVIEGEDLTIIHTGDYAKWIATAKLNRELCSAVVDFNEQGVSEYPSGNLTATYWVEVAQMDYARIVQAVFEFTDPSGVLAPAVHPLNRWVQLNGTPPWNDAVDVMV